MRRNAFLVGAFAVLMACCASAQDIAATWQGTFRSGTEEHRAVVEISKADHGGWAAPACYVEFYPDTVHVDSLVRDGLTVRFAMNGGRGSYEGKMSPDGSSISGIWTYDHHPAPLILQRANKETAWHVPFQYQYHFDGVTIRRPSPDEGKIPFTAKLALDYMEQGAPAWTESVNAWPAIRMVPIWWCVRL